MPSDATHSDFAIISHRCLGFNFKENSLYALRAAVESTVDGIEFDIRLTKDRKWVVLHNPFLKAEERAVLRVHEHLYSQVRREVVPLDVMLAVIASYGGGKKVMIDVKDVGEEKALVGLVRQYGLREQAIIISWEPEVLRRVHALDSAMRIGFSYVPIHSSFTYVRGSLGKPLSRHGVLLHFNAEHSFDVKHTVGKTHQHYLATIPDLPLSSIQVPGFLCSAKLVQLAHGKGIKVYPFVVNTRMGAALLRRRGVDGILTNEPKLFVKSSISSP